MYIYVTWDTVYLWDLFPFVIFMEDNYGITMGYDEILVGILVGNYGRCGENNAFENGKHTSYFW